MEKVGSGKGGGFEACWSMGECEGEGDGSGGCLEIAVEG